MKTQSGRAGFAVALPLAEMTPERLRPPPRRADRRRARVARFVLWETVAVAAMILSAVIGTSEQFFHPSLNRLFAGLLVLSAAAVALFFFCLPRGFARRPHYAERRASQVRDDGDQFRYRNAETRSLNRIAAYSSDVAPTISNLDSAVTLSGSGTNQILRGNGSTVPNSGPGSADGNATISFDTSPVQSVTLPLISLKCTSGWRTFPSLRCLKLDAENTEGDILGAECVSRRETDRDRILSLGRKFAARSRVGLDGRRCPLNRRVDRRF